MAKNEVGEFELVLGNKQLLSVFFIVVILLGVFFTMGYIVGRNSGGPGALEAATRRGGAEPKPTMVDSPNAPAPTQVATATEPPASEPKKEEAPVAVPAPVVEAAKPVEPPKAEVKKPEPKKEDDSKAVAEKKREEKKREEKKKDAATAVEPAPASTGALSGTYLQLAAVPKTEADLMISVLRKRGFAAAAGPGPKDSNLFRVLVGPLAGTEAVASTRASLNDAGMPGSKAIVKRF